MIVPEKWYHSAQFLQEKHLGILKEQLLEKCLISMTRWFCLVVCAGQVSLQSSLISLFGSCCSVCPLVNPWCPTPAAGYTWPSAGAVGAARHSKVSAGPFSIHLPLPAPSLRSEPPAPWAAAMAEQPFKTPQEKQIWRGLMGKEPTEMRRGSQRSHWPASCKNNPSDMAIKSRLGSNLLQLLMVHSLTPALLQNANMKTRGSSRRHKAGPRVAQRERKLCLAKARDDGGAATAGRWDGAFKVHFSRARLLLRNLISFGSVQANC